MCLVFLGSGFETWRRIFMSCVLQPGTAGATQHLSQGFFWAQLLVPQKHFKWSRPSLRIFSVTNALVCFCVHSYYCCDCIDVRWKVLFLCEVQAKAYAKVPVYPPTRTPLFSCEVTVCVRICCVDIFQKWAWYCPPQFGQQFTCVGFCDTKQEMWSRWRKKKKKKAWVMCRLPAFCNAQLWPLFHCLWLMGLLLAEKKIAFPISVVVLTSLMSLNLLRL